MTQVRYRDLTEEMIQQLKDLKELNGCGSKGGWLNVPDWIFTASCWHHDFNYWLGGTEEDRKKADWQFYQAMLYDASKAVWWKRPWYRTMAWVYYKAVRQVSSVFFPYGEMRTLEDLQELLGKPV